MGLGALGELIVTPYLPLHAAVRRLVRWSLPLGSLSQRSPPPLCLSHFAEVADPLHPSRLSWAWEPLPEPPPRPPPGTGPTLRLLCCSPPSSQLGTLPQPWTCFPQTPPCWVPGASLPQHSSTAQEALSEQLSHRVQKSCSWEVGAVLPGWVRLGASLNLFSRSRLMRYWCWG